MKKDAIAKVNTLMLAYGAEQLAQNSRQKFVDAGIKMLDPRPFIAEHEVKPRWLT